MVSGSSLVCTHNDCSSSRVFCVLLGVSEQHSEREVNGNGRERDEALDDVERP